MPTPALRTLAFLRGISGRRTALGIHNDLKRGGPDHCTGRFRAATGRHPALWSGDFLFDDRAARRWDMVREAERQWRAGALVNLMWHAAPPNQGPTCAWEGGVLSRLTDAEWADLIAEGGALNGIWKARMDDIAPYLAWLAEKGVEALWRPLHEMNQEKFWWGGRPGPEGSSRLFRLTHDHFTRALGLRNLVWTWDVQDLRFDWDLYHPGDAYFDVLAVDVYSMGFTDRLYREALRLAGGKPIALGEVAELPSPEILRRQPRYAFAMGWADLALDRTAPDTLRALAAAPNVLFREGMPGWDGPATT